MPLLRLLHQISNMYQNVKETQSELREQQPDNKNHAPKTPPANNSGKPAKFTTYSNFNSNCMYRLSVHFFLKALCICVIFNRNKILHELNIGCLINAIQKGKNNNNKL